MFKRLSLGCFGIVALVIIVVIIASVATNNKGGSASASQGATASTTAAATIGQVVSVKNWNLSVVNVEKPGQSLVYTQFGNKSTAVGTWIVVEVDLKNTGKENFGVNTTDFVLLDSAGDRYNVSSDIGALTYSTYKGDAQIGGQVPPGADVKYLLPFDVSSSASGLRLQFAQDSKPTISLGQ